MEPKVNYTLKQKYDLMIHFCRVVKYGGHHTGEFKLGGRTIPIIEDEFMIKYQLSNLIAWIYEHPGKIFRNMQIHDKFMRTQEIKVLVHQAMAKLPSDSSECCHFITGINYIPANVISRMVALLVCHTIMVDEKLETAKDQYMKIMNCLTDIMNAMLETKAHHNDLLYTEFSNYLNILSSIMGGNDIIEYQEFDERIRMTYFNAVMKDRLHPKNIMDVRSFKRMVDEYIYPLKGAEGTVTFLRTDFFPKHSYLYETKSYADYIDDLDSYFQF